MTAINLRPRGPQCAQHISSRQQPRDSCRRRAGGCRPAASRSRIRRHELPARSTRCSAAATPISWRRPRGTLRSIPATRSTLRSVSRFSRPWALRPSATSSSYTPIGITPAVWRFGRRRGRTSSRQLADIVFDATYEFTLGGITFYVYATSGETRTTWPSGSPGSTPHSSATITLLTPSRPSTRCGEPSRVMHWTMSSRSTAFSRWSPSFCC